jgi:3-deoxy-7-phosphoheptulonate synthase
LFGKSLRRIGGETKVIIMKPGATQDQIEKVVAEVELYGVRAEVCEGNLKTVIDLIGDEERISFDHLAVLPGVKEAFKVVTPFKLISREYVKHFGNALDNKTIEVKNVKIGGETPVYIAGPCAIESYTQVMRIAEGVKEAGAQILRGGIFKLRSSVHSFQG